MIDEKKLIKELSKNSVFEKITNAEGKNVFEIIEAQPQVGGWIPVTYHAPVKEDGEDATYAYILDCPMPEEGQEILISFNGVVDMDVCCYDEGWYLDNRGDWTDVDAWMPLPAPYKESDKE